MFGIAQKLLGSVNDRKIRPYRSIVQRINALEPVTEALSDEALKQRTRDFRQQVANGASLGHLPEAFATVARRPSAPGHAAFRRPAGRRHGAAFGRHCRRRTGEGEDLVATSAVYLNALEGAACHVITVNDYLAAATRNGWGKLPLPRLFGRQDRPWTRRQPAPRLLRCDVTYGTNTEFGFDYLRDNMKYSLADWSSAATASPSSTSRSRSGRRNRTPLIISDRPTTVGALHVDRRDHPALRPADFTLDESSASVVFSETGNDGIEELMVQAGIVQGSLYGPANITLVHHCQPGAARPPSCSTRTRTTSQEQRYH